jgi:hypothetical protein
LGTSLSTELSMTSESGCMSGSTDAATTLIEHVSKALLS